MKSRRLVIGAVVVIVAIAFVCFRMFFAASHIQIKVTGPPGMQMKGICQADGRELTIGPAQIPNTVTVRQGRSVSYTIESVGEPGPMTVEVLVDGDSRGSVTADGAYTVVRGSVQNGKVDQAAEQKSN